MLSNLKKKESTQEGSRDLICLSIGVNILKQLN